MKKIFYPLLALLTLSSPLLAKDDFIVGIVNLKSCAEKSLFGKDESHKLDQMRNEMVQTLEKKEKELTEIAEKLKNPEFLDSLSHEAEEDLKLQYRSLAEELSRIQNQYYQAYNQANYKMVQTLQMKVSEASEKVAKAKKLGTVFNEEVCFFFENRFDITDDVIAQLNNDYKDK